MQCFLCGKKIGRLQAWVDQQYCCSEHRQEARLASAQALRDEEDQELWSVSKSRKRPVRSTANANQAASISAILTVGAMLAAVLIMPRGDRVVASPRVSLDSEVKRGFFERAGDTIGEVIRTRAPVTLHDDFRAGWSAWTSIPLRNSGLRIWSRSTALKNYQMEFSGQIEKKSLSWVFRATDEKNYYATKLVMTKPSVVLSGAPVPNAGLIRYVMMNGREWDRVQTPLPLTLERGGTYRVRVSVEDDRFITYINGQAISSWIDKRLPRGGVGFFEDRQDPQQVAWVSVSERDSILGRVLAHFSLILMPGTTH